MDEGWVVNASPLICLAKVSHLQLLSKLARQIWLPDAVAREILAGPDGDPARKAVESGEFPQRTPRQIPSVIIDRDLGAGESAVLALAMELDAVAVLDDAAARSAAKALNVRLVGTIGVVLRALLNGFLPSASAVLADLKSAGLRIDDHIISSALFQIGEPWPYSAQA